ncbi:hypothetical protein BH10ACI1_BH10ACI1_35650 [soil metagenome]
MKFLFFTIFFIFCFTCFFSTEIFPQTIPTERDISIRTDTSLTFPLLKSTNKKGKEFDRLTFSINGILRFGDNASRLNDERIGFGLGYRLNKNVSFSGEYFYRVTQPVKNRNDFESRVRFAVTFENKWRQFSLADRNMIEYRMRNSRPNSFRYRNRIRFNYPILNDNKEVITPFVSEEPFYDFRIDKWAHNEFLAGFAKKFNKNFAADFYYLLVHDRSNPKTVNGFGMSFKFKIE